jgi:hypothetical protein
MRSHLPLRPNVMLLYLVIILLTVLPLNVVANSPTWQRPLGGERVDASSASWKAHQFGQNDFVSLRYTYRLRKSANAYED